MKTPDAVSEPIPADFELSNLQRRHLGLDEVEPHWDKVRLNDRILLYFDGDIIRKMVEHGHDDYNWGHNQYHESDHYELTAENRTMLLPKTKRGKPKKLNYTATKSFSSQGVYFSYTIQHVRIGNYTTQTSFYEADHDPSLSIEAWLEKWVKETTERNMEDLREFKTAKRVHQKYSEGDFFTFRIGRNKWGFGRILLNIALRRKSEQFKEANPGLAWLMGQALYIGVYRYMSDTPEVDIDELRQCPMLPSQAIMDNRIYYGEYRIIGNRPVEAEEWEPLISCSRAFRDGTREGTPYLQYGLICQKKPFAGKIGKYLKKDKREAHVFSNEAIGFFINHYSELEKIITEDIDNDSLLRDWDLRKSTNREAKEEIFRYFGLDADKSYAENLRMAGEGEKPKVSFERMKALFSSISGIGKK